MKYIQKVNTAVRASGNQKPKTTPLVEKILYTNRKSQTCVRALKWGMDNESNALKEFYAKEAIKHTDYKIENCGLYVLKSKPYIAASPDGILRCKCHGQTTIEIKCPFKIRHKTVAEGAHECDFLTMENSIIMLKKTHKYYTQIQSQMEITKTKQAFFVVWTMKDVLIQQITVDKEHIKKVFNNLDIFFKTYVCPALLGLKPATFCAKCDKVLLE